MYSKFYSFLIETTNLILTLISSTGHSADNEHLLQLAHKRLHSPTERNEGVHLHAARPQLPISRLHQPHAARTPMRFIAKSQNSISQRQVDFPAFFDGSPSSRFCSRRNDKCYYKARKS